MLRSFYAYVYFLEMNNKWEEIQVEGPSSFVFETKANSVARIGEICFLFSFLSFFFSLPFFLVNLIFSICLFIEVWLIYLMMLVSGAQRSGSVLLQIMLHYRLLQGNGYTSLCCILAAYLFYG